MASLDVTPSPAMKIAVVGSGVSGLCAAFLLSRHHDVTLFEAEERLGGHAHTVTVKEDDGEYEVDTGFLVYNEVTYPLFISLLDQLGVRTIESEMSFSYRDRASGLEWKGSTLNSIFAQRRNLLRPRFVRMVLDILRFNRTLRELLVRDVAPDQTIGQLLADRPWSREFRDWYLLPMGAAIWSASPATFADMPVRTFAEFFSRHGLLNVRGMPTWRTIAGGSREYVAEMAKAIGERGTIHVATPVRSLTRHADRVALVTDEATSDFDHVVVACHSDEALALLADPTDEERRVLGSIRYQANSVTLHSDTSLLPASRRAWAAWNYLRDPASADVATLTYNVSTLQTLRGPREYLVSLNCDHLLDQSKVIERFDYAHPVLDQVTVEAQHQRHQLTGRRTSFCGAYFGYGFHEDGVRSATEICQALGVTW